ncbi:ead/Ea22-like family protein [Enterobacter roggenkampii]|uniref:ead/Ea22-like family protein n=1 Tax=Enterobacter roggenkampii TaxID=1812935 RepID=UPI001C9B07BD|nr:ead/Ea22-like family protein [Enterobacter roggenkampii]MBY7249232.1 ead/Ea22-like family protein [Enterobacter roggenkampii]
MSNIDKQALRGQSVEGSFYLVECCNCGEMYPSNLLDGGEAIADSGDYGDCYCHLCGADDTERADWGDVNSNEAKAWNFQQKRIEALLDELEAADKRIAELEAVTPEQRAEHDAGMKEFAAMLQGADRPQNETQNIPENIPATQFKPVADLYGLTSPTGSETSFTFDAVEARDFIGGGWSCQEYVELERFQEAVSGNSPVIPDGWVMVPVEPTEKMVIEGFESEPDEFFSKSEEWEAYQEMSGCEQAAHRAKLCWAAMLAAAPQQEVK